MNKRFVIPILVILIFASIPLGCLGSRETTISYSTTIYSPATTSTSYQAPPEKGVQVTVIHVIDGDTMDVAFQNGTVERVRFLGIDTPETTVSRNKPGEYDDITDLECLAQWGIKAKEYTKKTLEGKVVYLLFDPIAGKRGYYGRLLAYVYYNGEDFTAELVKKGYARVYTEGQFKKEDEYVSYQSLAMKEGAGLWGACGAFSVKGSGKVIILTVHYDAAGKEDDRKNLNDEYVVLKNTGSSSVNLEGWMIMDKARHAYVFPRVVLKPGETLTLHTGKGVDGGKNLYWGSGSPIWNNDGDTAYLYDTSGNLVDTYTW